MGLKYLTTVFIIASTVAVASWQLNNLKNSEPYIKYIEKFYISCIENSQ